MKTLTLCLGVCGLCMATTLRLCADGIPITAVQVFPNSRVSDDPPPNAVDGNIDTWTWCTEAWNFDPASLAVAFESAQVNRLRIWKDRHGGGGAPIKNLIIQFTTDQGLPLQSRRWQNVSGLTSGYMGREYLHATSVDPQGYVSGDVHSSAEDGWGSLVFSPVYATGLRICFSLPPEILGQVQHYRVAEIEALYSPVDFTVKPLVLSENSEPYSVALERLWEPNKPAAVSYVVLGGTATPGLDFLLQSGVLEYAAGVTNISLPLAFVDDALVEGPETILVGLTNLENGWATTVPLTILDDDTGMEFEQDSSVVSEAAGQVVLGVRRVDDSKQRATVEYTTVDGSAKAGSDYVVATGSLTFAPGETHKEIVVHILNDNVREMEKSFTVQLKEVTGGSGLGAATLATVAIQDDDLGSRNFYYAGFEGVVGPEWSMGKTDVTPVGNRRFLGQFGTDSVSLRLANLPPHTNVTVALDLFIIESWDGNWEVAGPDVWDLSVTGGPTLLHATFANYPESIGQTYPDNYPGPIHPIQTGASEINTLGYSYFGDSAYYLCFAFPHTNDQLELNFSRVGLEWLDDESWGLDNVSVALGASPSNTVYSQTRLALTGSWMPPGNTTIQKVSASGSRAVVLTGNGQICLLDLGSQTGPTQVGSWAPEFSPYDAKMSGDIAYIATYELDLLSSIEIVDFSNPSKPVLLGTYDTPGYAQALAVKGSTLYVADADGGLLILDASDPARPYRLGGFSLKKSVSQVKVSGRYAYVVAGVWLLILDVSDPANPHRVGLYEAAVEIVALQPTGSRLYLTEAVGDLRILDVTDPGSIDLLGSYRGWGNAPHQLIVSSSRALLARGESGLQLVGVSDPTKPTWITGTPWGQVAEDVALVGNKVLVAGGPQGLRVYELQNHLYPPLRLERTPGGLASLSWPSTDGIRLQKATNLLNPTWIDLPESETTSTLQFSTTEAASFFRLAMRPKPIQVPPGLVGWWPGNGNTKDSAGSHDGILRGDTTFVEGQVDQAFSLDGDGDFVEVPDTPDLNLGTSDFTACLWVRLNSLRDEQTLVEKYIETFGPGRKGWGLHLYGDGVLHFYMADASTEAVPSFFFTEPLQIPVGNWIHLAIRRGPSSVTFYQNGLPLGHWPAPGNVSVDSTSSLKFGHRGNPQDTPGSFDARQYYLDGMIDEVMLFNRALTDAEIGSIFEAETKGLVKPMR